MAVGADTSVVNNLRAANLTVTDLVVSNLVGAVDQAVHQRGLTLRASASRRLEPR